MGRRPNGGTRLLPNRLPVAIEPFADESGMGFCLRAAAKNGVGLSDLSQMIALGPKVQFSRSHAHALAQVLGIDERALSNMLPSESRRKNIGPFACYGLTLKKRAALRGLRPQVCPECLKQYGYTRALWDLSLSTVCLEHQVGLSDCCPKCLAPLRWHRKAVHWGHCGHQLIQSDATATLGSGCLKAQVIFERKWRSESVADVLSSEGLFPWFDALTVDGWLSLIYMFGVQSPSRASAQAGALNRVPSCEEARKLIEQAMFRLRGWCGGGMASSATADLLCESSIKAGIFLAVTPADRDVMTQIFLDVFGSAALVKLQRQQPGLWQLPLF